MLYSCTYMATVGVKRLKFFHRLEAPSLIFPISERCYVVVVCWFSVNELLKAKEELTQDRDAKLQEITMLRQKISEALESEQKLEKERDDAQNKLQEVCHAPIPLHTARSTR